MKLQLTIRRADVMTLLAISVAACGGGDSTSPSLIVAGPGAAATGAGNGNGAGVTPATDAGSLPAVSGSANSDSVGTIPTADAGSIAVVAGTLGLRGNVDGIGTAAQFDGLNGITTDAAGNLYVANFGGTGTIRQIAPTGVVSTLLTNLTGSNGPPFFISNAVTGLAYNDTNNELLYSTGDEITVGRKIPLNNERQLYFMTYWSRSFDTVFAQNDVTVDRQGNIFVAFGTYIRKRDRAGDITTFAGDIGSLAESRWPKTGSADGVGENARFNDAYSIAVDKNSGTLYVADSENRTIRKITPDGVVSTLAGLAGQAGTTDGLGAAARFTYPRRVTVDQSGNIYVIDSSVAKKLGLVISTGNCVIRKITPAGQVTTVAGQVGDDVGTRLGQLPGKLSDLRGIVAGIDGALYVTSVDAVLKLTLPLK